MDSFGKWSKTDVNNASPCPMLNTLKNYGILPGNNIPSKTVYDGLIKIGCDTFISDTLTSVFQNNFENAKNLTVLGNHNVIEHDVSLTREDAHLGDHIHYSKKRLKKMMSYSSDGKYLTLKELAEYFKYQKQYSLSNNEQYVWNMNQKNISLVEQSILFLLLRDHTGNIPLKWLEYFITKEKLPFKYGFELRPITTFGLIRVASQLFVLEYIMTATS